MDRINKFNKTNADKSFFKLLAITYISFFVIETIFRMQIPAFKVQGFSFLELCFRILLTFGIASFIAFPVAMIRNIFGKILSSLLMLLSALIFSSQIVYYEVFGTFYSIYSMFHGGQVVEFMPVIIKAILDNVFSISIMIICAIIYIVVIFKAQKVSIKRSRILLITLALIVFGNGISLGIVRALPDKPNSPHHIAYGISSIKETMRAFGIFGSACCDLQHLSKDFVPELDHAVTKGIDKLPSNKDLTDKNIVNSYDLSELAKTEKDPTLKNMDAYFAGRMATSKNRTTSLFEGKNLIFVTAESFSDLVIDKELTPTLYRMAHGGFYFDNFYNPVWAVSTIDGEYVNMTGQIPKPGVWSLTEASNNYLPQALGNQFRERGYKTLAYHNHSVYFYERLRSHPNLGYKFDGQDKGYHFKKTWPESDFEMIDKTTKDFLTPGKDGKIQPFSIYYLTVSGHLEYSFEHNDMAVKNRKFVEGLDLSEESKAYLACNIELDRAMKLLIERLKAAGELDNTVIVIEGDHYPYALSDSAFSELRGHMIDSQYERFKSTCLIWNSGMKPETISKAGSNLDILPTVSNLFGLPYDSRIMMGRDMFSDAPGFVVLEDNDWISDRGKRRDIKDDDYVAKMDKIRSDMLNYSALVLDEDYYRYLQK